MKYLLDICVISDFVKGDVNTIENLQQTLPSQISISTVTLMELEYGLKLNPGKTAKVKK